MFEVGIHFGFTEKTFADRNIVHQVGTNNLHGNFTPKSGALSCQIDLTHTSYANTIDEIIIPKALRAGRPALSLLPGLLGRVCCGAFTCPEPDMFPGGADPGVDRGGCTRSV